MKKYTIKELSVELGLTTRTVGEYIKSGKIERLPNKFGRNIMVSQEMLDKFYNIKN